MYPPQGNGMAVAGLVLGILGLVMCWIVIGWILALLGIIFGAIGLGKAKRVGKGKGMALAGLICGVLGIVVGIVFQIIVVAAFTDYMKKSKRTEASLQLDNMARKIKTYHIEKSRPPPSAETVMPGPDGAGCQEMSSTGKMPARPQSAWEADPGWGAMDFSIDEPSLFSYHWTKVSETEGHALAVGDLDCDGTLATYRLDITVTEGNVQHELSDPTPD